jgi:tRNA-Thr(GGU) m(6)t(6)A37 methyltransferase TsaA
MPQARPRGHRQGGSDTVPGPRASNWWGLTRQLKRDQLGTFERMAAEYGDVVRLVVGPPGLHRELYLVTHPDGVEQVLAGDPDGYSKNTPFYNEISAYLGNGLLTSGGPRWRQQRRTVAPLFSHRHIDSYVAVMADEAKRMTDQCGVAAAAGTSVDVHAVMVEYTLRTVGRVLFGADVDDAVPVIRDTFPVLNEHVRRRGLTPLRLPRQWPTPAQTRAAAAQRALYGVVDDIIDRRSGAAAPGRDLISLLLDARDPDTGAPMSNQEVRDQVLIFLLAGHETTSTALTFTVQLLGRHPDVQAAVHHEIAEVLAGRVPRADDVARLTLTEMAVKEAMRLYPPAYSLGRLAEHQVTIAGERIPAGSIILLSQWATHRRPDLWPDPQRFDPTRFEPAAEQARPRYAYFPFAGGLRGCIGGHFAMTEAVVAIATLLARFRVISESADIRLLTDITLRPAGPVWCRLVPLTDSPPTEFTVRPIGRVESPLTSTVDAPRQGDEGAPEAYLILNPDIQAGLDGLSVGDEIIVLTWLHEADRSILTVHPRGDLSRPEQGVFTTRAPSRPNPVGLHRVRVLGIDGRRLHVSGLEAIDGTPLVDLKPVLGSIEER